MALDKSLIGCLDDWNSLDHFDPTMNSRRMMAQMFYLRSVYGALRDGFGLVQQGNWTYQIERPGSNGTATEMGLWSISRSGITSQTLSGNNTDEVWMLYTNENTTKTWTYDCTSSNWISTPYQADTIVRNLFYPYENYTLQASLSSYNKDNQAPYFGCLNSVTMDPYSFKVLVPQDAWVAPLPALTKFTPGHDYRILSNSTTVQVSLEFNTPMDCPTVTAALSLNMSSSGNSTSPSIDTDSVTCVTLTNAPASMLSGDAPSAWSWTANIKDMPDGILQLILDNPTSQAGTKSGVRINPLYFLCKSATDTVVFVGRRHAPSPQGSG